MGYVIGMAIKLFQFFVFRYIETTQVILHAVNGCEQWIVGNSQAFNLVMVTLKGCKEPVV